MANKSPIHKHEYFVGTEGIEMDRTESIARGKYLANDVEMEDPYVFASAVFDSSYKEKNQLLIARNPENPPNYLLKAALIQNNPEAINNIREAYKSFDKLLPEGTRNKNELFQDGELKEEFRNDIDQARTVVCNAMIKAIPDELLRALKGPHQGGDKENKELATLAIFNIVMAAVFATAKDKKEMAQLQTQYKVFQETGMAKDKSLQFLEVQRNLAARIASLEPYSNEEKQKAVSDNTVVLEPALDRFDMNQPQFKSARLEKEAKTKILDYIETQAINRQPLELETIQNHMSKLEPAQKDNILQAAKAETQKSVNYEHRHKKTDRILRKKTTATQKTHSRQIEDLITNNQSSLTAASLSEGPATEKRQEFQRATSPSHTRRRANALTFSAEASEHRNPLPLRELKETREEPKQESKENKRPKNSL